MSRTVYFYQPDTRRDEPVIHSLAERYPRYGFKKLLQLLRRKGLISNASSSPSRSIYSVFCALAAAISVLFRDFNTLGMFLHLVFLAFWQRGAKQDT